MKRRILILGIVFSILVPALSYAEDKSNYIALKSGLRAFRSDLRKGNIDIGFDGGIVYGRYLTRSLVLEAGAGYSHDGVNKGFGNDVKAWPITLTAKGVYPVGDFEFFVGVGGGVYFARFHGMVNGEFANANDNVFGGHFIAGANYDISRRLFVGLEWKYIGTEKGDFNVLKSTLSGYTYTAGFGFRF